MGIRTRSHPKAILPTELIFQASGNLGAACRLPVEWTTCLWNSSSKSSNKSDYFCRSGNESITRRSLERLTTHDFDELTTDGDSHFFDKDNVASIYHFQSSLILYQYYHL